MNTLPEYVVTDHSKLRLAERIHVSPRKMLKLCVKAWNGKSVTIPKLVRTQNKNDYFYEPMDGKHRVARELMGYVFLFEVRGNQKILITVI